LGLRLIVRVICRWLHTPSFATVSPQEVSGSSPAELRNFGKDSACGFLVFEINAYVLFLSKEAITMEMEPYDCSPGYMRVFPLLTQENANLNNI